MALRFIVFADFNCPFCYALSELFHALELDEVLEWRPVQHAPSISSDQCTYDVLCELASEVAEVRRRAPSTEISTPSFRPNSRLASEVLAETFQVDPVKGAELRVLIYRALWLHGLDISNHAVLNDLASSIDMQLPVISLPTKSNLIIWQQKWEQEDYDGNIPITTTSEGECLIGFPQQDKIEDFISTGYQSEVNQSAACVVKPKQKLLIFDSDPASIQLIMSVMGNYDVNLVNKASGLYRELEAHHSDLVIMNMDTLKSETPALYQGFRTDPLLKNIPVVLTAEDTGADQEEVAFNMGASDFIRKPFSRAVLTKRLTAQMGILQSRNLLEKMARFDALTGAYNRREFDTRLQIEWDRYIRSGISLSVLMIDIDNFKEFNDNYGHHRGDECLKTIADILNTSIYRPGDLFARYGGEEFVAILIGVDEASSRIVAERCRCDIENKQITHEYSPVAKSVTISIGCATAEPEKIQSPQVLVESADKALYVAKKSGRNRVSGFLDHY